MGKIDVYEVASQCRKGELEVFTKNGCVYMEDKDTGDNVNLTEAQEERTESGSREQIRPRRSRTENIFGPRESWGQSRDQDQGPYKGFLLIKCESCGRINAYCARQETYISHCDCGEETVLENLLIMHMHCKCGKNFRYRTNIKDRKITHKCLDCKAPVDIELNGRGTAYVTVGYRR